MLYLNTNIKFNNTLVGTNKQYAQYCCVCATCRQKQDTAVCGSTEMGCFQSQTEIVIAENILDKHYNRIEIYWHLFLFVYTAMTRTPLLLVHPNCVYHIVTSDGGYSYHM